MDSAVENLIISLATFAAAVGTCSAVILSFAVLRRSTDPNVIVYTEQDEYEPRFLYIVIANVGQGPATNVDFKLSTPLSHEIVFFPKPLRGAFYNGISLLPAGAKRRYLWGDFGKIMEDLGDRKVLCDVSFSGRIYFTSFEKSFHNSCVLEAESYRDSVDVRINDPYREMVRELEKLRCAIPNFETLPDALKNIETAIRELSRR
jgi:hypothetical protein